MTKLFFKSEYDNKSNKIKYENYSFDFYRKFYKRLF